MSASRFSSATVQAVPLLMLTALALLSQRSVLSFELTGTDTPLLLAASVWEGSSMPPALHGPTLGDPTLGIEFYRPLTALSYGLNLHTTGLDPLPYHLGDLTLHIGVVLLLFLVAQRLLSTGPGLSSAAVFALHPLLVEVVPDVSRRGDILAALLILGTLLAELRGHRRLSPVLCALAPLAKETGLAAGVLLIWMRLRIGAHKPGGEQDPHEFGATERWRKLGGVVVVFLCMLGPLLLRWLALKGMGGYQWRPEEWRLIAHALDSLRLLVDPAGWLPVDLARLIAVAIAAIVMWLAGSNPGARCALELGSLGIVFTIAAMGFTGRWVRPHLYLAVLFATIALAAAFQAGWARGGAPRRGALVVCCSTILALSCTPLWTPCQEWRVASGISRALVGQARLLAHHNRPLRIVGLPDRVLPLSGPGLRAHHVGVFTARGLMELLHLMEGEDVEVEAPAYLNVPAGRPDAGVLPTPIDSGRLRVSVEAPARIALLPAETRDEFEASAGAARSIWWVHAGGLSYRWLSIGRPHEVEFLAEPGSEWWGWHELRGWSGRTLERIPASLH